MLGLGSKDLETALGKGRRTLILVNACVITFMATLDGSIVNIALPTIAKSFGAGISAVQWVSTSYLLTVSALLLIWGRLSDIYGRKRFFATGLFVFTLGSVLCGFSSSLLALVSSRILQAIGASMSMALVQGIVTAAFPPAERGKALGLIGSVVAIGSLVGPSLGGLLVQAAGWRSIFFINAPIGLLGIVLTFIVMPESKGARERFDAPGALLLVASVILFFAGMLSFQEGLLPLPAAIVFALAAFILLAAFLAVERRSKAPLVDGAIFRNRVFTMGVIDSFLSFTAMFSYVFFMPFYLQNVRGLGVLQAGALMSVYPAVTAFLSPLSGALSDRIPYRFLTIAGLLLNATGLALLSTLGPATPLAVVGGLIFLLGAGGAFFSIPQQLERHGDGAARTPRRGGEHQRVLPQPRHGERDHDSGEPLLLRDQGEDRLGLRGVDGPFALHEGI